MRVLVEVGLASVMVRVRTGMGVRMRVGVGMARGRSGHLVHVRAVPVVLVNDRGPGEHRIDQQHGQHQDQQPLACSPEDPRESSSSPQRVSLLLDTSYPLQIMDHWRRRVYRHLRERDSSPPAQRVRPSSGRTYREVGRISIDAGAKSPDERAGRPSWGQRKDRMPFSHSFRIGTSLPGV